MTSEQDLAWAKWVEAHRAQSVIINTLSKINDFDRIKTVRSEHRQIVRKLHTPAKMPMKQKCNYYGSGHPTRQCPAYGKKHVECGKMNHVRSM